MNRDTNAASDLIDFSDDSSESFVSSSTTPIHSLHVQHDSVADQNNQFLFELEDYRRKPRVYDRGEVNKKDDDKPPPLPPKRRNQSRKNIKLTDRLKTAGVDISGEIINTQSSKFGLASRNNVPSQTDVKGDGSLLSRSVLDTQVTQSANLPSTDHAVHVNNMIVDDIDSPKINHELPRSSYSDNLQYFTRKSHIENMNDLKKSQSFESRLKNAMRQDDVDLIKQNLIEFEILSKPADTILPASSSNKYSSNRVSSWENLLKATNKASLTSLSVEDLNAFVEKDALPGTVDGDRSVKTVNFQESSLPELSSGPSQLSRSNTIPPPRPPPPKSFQRFSLPVDFGSTEQPDPTLYFGDGIFDLTEERNEEAVAFCNSVAQLRSLYKFTDQETNPGYVSTPVVNWKWFPCSKEIKAEIYFEERNDSLQLEFDMFSNIEDLVSKALSVFQNMHNNIDTISKNAYIFKVCGEASYMTGNGPFISYTYVQDCLKLNKKIKIALVQRNKISRELERTEEDDTTETNGMYFKNFFNLTSTTSISRQGLSVLIDTYNCEVEKLLSNVSKKSGASYLPEKIIQIVKAMSLSLAYVETSQIHEAVNLLLSLKPKSKEDVLQTPTPSDVIDYNRIINANTFDKGRLNLALEKLTSGVFSVVDAYCKAFDTDFAIHNPKHGDQDAPGSRNACRERISSGTLADNFTVRIASAHRIHPNWKTRCDYFEVECNLFYGGRSLCGSVLTKVSKPVKGFFEHIRWDEMLYFNLAVKEIPRETRLCIALYGLNSTRKQTTEAKNRIELGWIGVNLFDFQGIMISGCHLFGLISATEMNSAAICSNNIQERASVVLKADFEVYYTDVIFPEPLVKPSSGSCSIACFSEVSLKFESILSHNSCKDLSMEEKELLWKNRFDLRNVPKALSFVLMSMPDLKVDTITEAQELLGIWQSLPPYLAMELLKAQFPDILVRKQATEWLSIVNESELCDYLPQLVQALKYESYHNSSLAMFLIKSAIESPKIAHYLFWHLKYYTADAQFSQRFQIVLGGVLSICGVAMRDQLSRQDQMIQLLLNTTKKVKETKDNLRRPVLNDDLQIIATEVDGCLRLPINPAIQVKSINIEECSYFNSFTVPLSLSFANYDARGQPVKFMFKVGDDLRKDLITLQLFHVMNRLWLSEGLDLQMVTYQCMPTSAMAGMVELIQEAFTLREIHIQHGLTGSFKDEVLGLWLQKYNPSEAEYLKAVDNFSASCAAYCVATYILGIGDRHNDNIMLTKAGHMFHIDFSKILGNAQKFGTIRRDRVPFVLTPDMAYVINSGEVMSHNFQHFIEMCCEAFNIIRKNSSLILNLLGLMVPSGIAYLSTANDLDYVEHALQLQLSDAESTVFFTRLIETSLNSKSTQLNFFIHNVAHMKDSQSQLTTANALFTFSNKVYSRESDGSIISVRCVDIQKRYLPEKHYIFVLNILRENNDTASFVFRKYDEFQELRTKLSHVFGNVSLPPLPSRVIVGRSEIREVAVKRRSDLDDFFVSLMKNETIGSSEIVYTFLHSYIRDEQDSVKFADILYKLEQGMPKSRVGGEIKLSYEYSNGTFNVLVMHARNLVPRTIQGVADPYIKAYLLPDVNKSTKKKTKIVRKNLNPTYNQTLSYTMPLEELQQRTLQVTVWDYDAMGVNEYLGGVNCYLSTHDLSQVRTQWYQLKDLGIGT